MKLRNPRDYMELGMLIEAWSRGDKPVPRDIDEFKAQLKAKEIEAEITETSFTAIFHEKNNLVLKIPSPSMLEYLREVGHWPLPEFYNKVYTGPRIPECDTVWSAFNVERFAEYSITNCG